ncbi:MAG: AAA family ATPase [bacterium]|nr:AAA family ATPase [bacterium]
MNLTLKPRLVVISGIPAGGKTTIAEGLAKQITNSVYLSRDHVAYGGLLYVNHLAATPSLLNFEEYVAKDKVFPNDAELVETPFGKMTLIHDSARSDFYKRHAREQGHLIQGRLAIENMKAGKVAILEGFLPRVIESGALKKFMDQPMFASYPKYVIHVIASDKVCLARQKVRAGKDKEAAVRAKTGYAEAENFSELMAKEHPKTPTGLMNLPHLFLDTSALSTEESVKRCLDYIQEEPSN